MHFTCRSFIGRNDAGSWSQFWENEPDDPQLVSQKGHLFGLISIKSSSDSLVKEGHGLIEKLSANYFSSPQTSIASALENVIDLAKSTDLSSFDNYSLILVVVFRSVLYIASVNNNYVILSRSSQISLLQQGTGGIVKTLQGPLKDGDKILLSSAEFFDAIGWDKFKIILADSNIQSLEENILSLMYGDGQASNLSSALVQIHSDEEISSEPAAIAPPLDPEPVPVQPVSPPPFTLQGPSKTKKSLYISTLDLSALTRRKKLNIIVALILVIALFVSSYFGYQKNQNHRRDLKVAELTSQIDKILTNADAAKNLSIDNAQAYARQAADLLNQVKKISASANVASYEQRINSLLSQTGSSDTFHPEIFYDTSAISGTHKYSRILLVNSKLYLLDKTAGVIDVVDPSSKTGKNFSNNDKLKTALFITTLTDKLYFVTDKSVYQADQNSLTQVIDLSKIKNPLSPLALRSWNGAFYLLDAASPTIYKFPPNSKNFSEGTVWLKDGQKLADSPDSMTINGSIWVMNKNCQITPYTRGAAENFKPSGLPDSGCHDLITSPAKDVLLFIHDDNQLYVYNKEGQSSSKYDFGKTIITDFAFDDAANLIYVLGTDQKIYKLSI